MAGTRVVAFNGRILRRDSGRISVVACLNEAFRSVFDGRSPPGIIDVRSRYADYEITVGSVYNPDYSHGEYGRLRLGHEVFCALRTLRCGDVRGMAPIVNECLWKIHDGRSCPTLHFWQSCEGHAFRVVAANRELGPSEVDLATRLFFREGEHEGRDWHILYQQEPRTAPAPERPRESLLQTDIFRP